MKRLLSITVSLCLFFSLNTIQAEVSDQAQKSLEQKIEALQAELNSLKDLLKSQQQELISIKNTSPQGSQRVSAVPSPSPVAQNPNRSRSIPTINRSPFAPDIGLVADIVGTSSKTIEAEEGNDRISVRELELVIGSDIDPYSRLDSTITLSDFEDVEIEEAFATFWDLPGEVRGRIGRFHQNVGKAAVLHRDSLDTVDEPWVVRSYLGEHGIHQTGADLSFFTPLSSDYFSQQLFLGIMEGGLGHGGQLFGEDKEKPSFYAHLSNFWDINARSSLELGATYLGGADQEGKSLGVNAGAADITFIHRFDPIKRLKLQGEFFYQNRDNYGSAELDADEHDEHEEEGHNEESEDEHDHESLPAGLFSDSSMGLYALADLRLSQRWGLGARYDWVEPIIFQETDVRDAETGMSAYVTYYQSEFARWRLQYQYAELADGQNDNRVFLQGTFAIGAHNHQIN